MIALLLMMICVYPAQSQTVLKATVSHNTFRVGSKYTDPAESKDFWVPVPAWQAGTWRFDNQVRRELGRTAVVDYRGSITFGSQVDAKGNVWHLVRLGYPIYAESDRTIEVQTNNSVEVESSQTAFHVHLHFVVTTYRKGDRTIIKSVDGESDNEWSPGAGATVLCHSNDLNRRVRGKLIASAVDTVCHKTAPFEVDTANTGRFYDWLRANGKADLIPAGTP